MYQISPPIYHLQAFIEAITVMKNCLKMTQIASDAQERKLSTGEKLQMHTHLMMCPGCRSFVKNTDTLSQMMKAYKSSGDNTEDKE